MLINNPDYLRPIRDNNRDEVFLIEFHRVLKNTNMSIFRNLLRRAEADKNILKVFPVLTDYMKMTQDERYNATVLFNTPVEFVYNLSGEHLSFDLCNEFVRVFQKPYDFDHLHSTRMEAIVRNLLKHEFVKKVYILADNFTSEMKAYIRQTFEPEYVGTKVHAIEGDLVDSIVSIPEITTVFMSNSSDFIRLYEFDPKLVKDRMFMIADGYGNYEPSDSPNASDELRYANLQLFKSLHDQKICEVAYNFPFCIECAN